MNQTTQSPILQRGISNGQLLAMAPDQRAGAVGDLPRRTRRRLAHIAALGAAKLTNDGRRMIEQEQNRHHNRAFGLKKLEHAAELTELAAQLLVD